MKINRAVILLLPILLTVFLLPPITHAEQLTVKVGAYANPPKIFLDDKEHVVGFWPELIAHIAKMENWQIEYIWGTWNEGLDRLKSGKIDILPDVAVTAPRKKKYDFSKETVLASWSRFYINESTPDIESILDIKHKPIAVLKNSVNYTGPDGIKELARKFNLNSSFIEFESYDEVFNAVRNGFAFGGVTNRNYGGKNEKKYNLKQTSLLLQPSNINFAFPKNAKLTPALSAAIDKNIKSLKANTSSIYYQLLEQHFESAIAEKNIIAFPFWVKQLLLFLGVTVFISIFAVAISRIKLRNSENRYRRLTENARDMIYRMSLPDGHYEYVSPASVDLFGYTPEEFYQTATLIEKVIHPDWHKYFEEQWGKLITGGMPPFYEYQIIHKSGEMKWMHQRNVLISDKDGNPIAIEGIVTDITERKQAEDAIRASNAELRIFQQIVASVAELMSFVDSSYIYRSVNPAYCRFHDRKAEDIVGHSVAELNGDSTFQELIKPEIDKALSGETVNYESWFEFRGMGRRYVIVEYFPAWDENDEVMGAVVAVRDITEQKMAEEQHKELEAQLNQKYKMEAVGIMAGGIAHNFNNNLAIILGNVELAQLKQPENSEFVPLLKNAKIAALRARDLIQNILTYSREGTHDSNLIQLPLVINETINLLRSTIPTTVKIEQTIHPDCNDATVNADSSQIQEALFNLCNNAVHAMDEKGELKVLLDTVDLQAQDIPAQYDCLPGRYVQLSIQDSGSGMTAETIDKIFDPFFTTKEVGQGTGMGLSTVQGIIKRHKGLIKVKSTPGEGTTFDLYFPVIDQNQRIEIEPEDTTLPRGTEHILFVDDDELLATLGGELLTEAGYQVTTITDSTKTLKIFAANADQFDLVITDQTMPELCGKELIQNLKKIRPDIPTILCTGYSNKVDEEAAAELGINAFLLKPVKLPMLLQTVRRVLDEKEE